MSLGGGYNSSNTSGETTQQGTTTTSRNEAPGTAGLTSTFGQYLMKLFQNPSSVTAPAQSNARNQVDENYAGADADIRNKFLSTGGGASGKYGSATVASDLSRRKALSDVDTSFQEQNAMMPLTAAGLATSLLGTTGGTTTAGSGSTTSQGHKSGWGINAGTPW